MLLNAPLARELKSRQTTPPYEAARRTNPSLCSNLSLDVLSFFAIDGVANPLK